jgi:hypothetical protein
MDYIWQGFQMFIGAGLAAVFAAILVVFLSWIVYGGKPGR